MAKLDLISFPSWDSSVVRASDLSEGPEFKSRSRRHFTSQANRRPFMLIFLINLFLILKYQVVKMSQF